MPTPGPIVSPPANPTGVVANVFAACVQTSTGDVSCWGFQSGLDAAGRDASTPALLGTPQRLFTAGTRDVVMTDNDVVCWSSTSSVSCAGDNTYGQLGVGDTNPRAMPVNPMLPQGTVLGIATAGRGVCALLKDTTSTSVWCWGANDYGQVDINAAAAPIATPRRKDLSQFPQVVDIASSQHTSFHTCALLADTSVVCWGNNSDGQLGRLPVATAAGAPDRVVRASDGLPLTGVTKLSLGYASSCAMVGGKVACWGSNSFGQLGRGGTPDGGFDPRASADFVVGLTQVTSLAVGYRHACAVVAGTDVWCWGDNGAGGVGSMNVGQPIAMPTHVLP
jgi:alpha-tubulin suppressor-like RCC1 family protein